MGFIDTEMDTMALAAREREREREHPTASSALLRPAIRGVARSCSPHENKPTQSKGAINDGRPDRSGCRVK